MFRNPRHRSLLTAGCIAALAALPCGSAAQFLDVPFVPTPHEVVSEMLKMAGAGPDDVVYDLGSGDGRIVIAAIRDFGVRRAVGVDIDHIRVFEGQANAAKAGIGSRARFVQGNVFDFDFSEATVLAMYLLSSVNRELRPRILAELKPGTRVVSHRFAMGEWQPDRSAVVGDHEVYFWVVPAKAEGDWTWEAGGDRYRLELRQEFQKVKGTLSLAGREAPIINAQLTGDRLRFEAAVGESLVRFDGRISGEAIEATVRTGVETRVVARRIR